MNYKQVSAEELFLQGILRNIVISDLSYLSVVLFGRFCDLKYLSEDMQILA